MGKRAAASGAPADYCDEEDDEELAPRWGRWRTQHPPRTYVRAGLQRTEAWRVLPDPIAFGGASGASTSMVVDAEFLRVPVARGCGEGEERTPPIGASDHLFVYRHSVFGEWFEHTTSVARWLELAKTHPLVHTFYAYGGEFGLSLSLAVSGKAFAMGMNTQQVDPSLVALWWYPMGTGWSPQETEAARSVFLDLCEVEAGSLWPSESSDVQEEAEGAAAAGAASGAPEGREKKIVHERSSSAVLDPVTYWRMVEAAEAQAKDETCGSADAEGEDSRGAASGASDLQGTQVDAQARARDAHRQVHFADAESPPANHASGRGFPARGLACPEFARVPTWNSARTAECALPGPAPQKDLGRWL